MNKFVAIPFCGLLISLSLFANTSNPACSMQMLCDQMTAEDSSYFKVSFDGEKASTEQDLETLFIENQIAILELLKTKKDTLPNSVFNQLVKDITTVTLGRFNEARVKNILPRACNRPNAIFIPGRHQVIVCPSLLRFPKETLRQILAHEMGHVVHKMQEYVACFKDYPKSQSEEVFADWVASKVVSAKLSREKDPKVANQQAFESQLIFLNLACQNPAKKKDWAPSHLDFQKRIENIFLSQPGFQLALGCQSKNVRFCD